MIFRRSALDVCTERQRKDRAAEKIAAVKREAQAAWESEASVVRQKVTDLAKELASTWPDTVMRLVDLFERIAAADREASSINSRAPTGVHHLRSVEASIGKGEKIIERVKLPVLTANGVVDAWPPRNTWALDYAESVRAGIVNAGPPMSEQQRIAVAAMMSSARQPTENERIAESARVEKFYADQEAGRIRLNEQAEARERSAEVERRRLRDGGEPRHQ